MKPVGAATQGFRPGSPLAACGRATRTALDADPEGRELWRLPAADEPLGDRLLALGSAGVGGFVEGGLDDRGVWLVRLASGATLAHGLRTRPGPWPWRDASALTLALARALAACEKASLFPGPLSPDVVLLGTSTRERPTFLADGLATAVVGGARSTTSGSARAWTPPEQSAGAVWDSAANRYVLGLVLYRLLAGADAFADGPALREPPPFEDAVAAALPSGLQSFALRLVDPDPARRPRAAGVIADELERFLSDEAGNKASGSKLQHGRSTRRGTEGARRGTEGVSAKREPSVSLRAPSSVLSVSISSGALPKPGARSLEPGAWSLKPLLRFWPLAAGLVVAGAAMSLLAPSTPKAKAAPIAEIEPLDESRTAATDCASCHGRQAGEWRRSVMAHAVKSPLFNALESLIEEQVGRDADCPNGAGILRKSNPAATCRDRQTGLPVTGSGGEHWCVNCHSPTENVAASMPAWDGRPGGDPRARRPVRDLLGERPFEGISCGFCHQVHGPVGGRGARGYQGNATWTSVATGAVFASRPEDGRGLFGIANSGYDLRPEDFLVPRTRTGRAWSARGEIDPIVHLRPPSITRAYLRSSEFCGSCHDVRLFGTDSLGVAKGEHFKRLRNAYSEWVSYADQERRAGREAATCQGCHMTTYPGVCEPAPGEGKATDPECPAGTRFVARTAGSWPRGRVADNSPEPRDVVTHYFSGVDVPLSHEFPDALVDEPTVDLAGIPLSARKRRDLLLRHTFKFALGTARRGGSALEIPLEVENTGAGHRIPAGFSQEREFWVHLRVKDGDGRLLYEVGRVDRGDEDLHDKVFARVNVSANSTDRFGRPEGIFGADVRDGPDLPQWSPAPIFGGTNFRGRGLINFQNGFLRCVRCIGSIGPDGKCQALPGQDLNRADRFADGDYDQDTGECRSNLTGLNSLFETYFPVGALDATRGITKGPDAIIDTRSVPPGVPIRYTYDLPTSGRRGPFRIEARLLFRAFPPFLVKGFIAYEREMARQGQRPSGPLVTEDMLRRLEIVELARASAEVP